MLTAGQPAWSISPICVQHPEQYKKLEKADVTASVSPSHAHELLYPLARDLKQQK